MQVFLNTDESPEVVLERIRAVAQGPQQVMVLYAVSEIAPEHAAKLWEATWSRAEETIEQEKGKN